MTHYVNVTERLPGKFCDLATQTYIVAVSYFTVVKDNWSNNDLNERKICINATFKVDFYWDKICTLTVFIIIKHHLSSLLTDRLIISKILAKI